MQISLASVLFVLGVSLLGADAASLIKSNCLKYEYIQKTNCSLYRKR